MADERKRLRRKNAPAPYGAVAPGTSSGEEVAPLLDDMEDNTKIGISTQTLVSNTGGDIPPKKRNQLIAGISVCLGAFALGTVLSWTSPTGKYLQSQFPNDTQTVSWIASAMPLGAAAVVLPAGWLMDTFGRKNTMLGLAPPFVVGWLLLLFANSTWIYILGRVITGMMGGAFSLTAPTYTAEIADNRLRGMLGGFFQLMVTVGILFVYILGASHASYSVLTGMCAAIPVLFCIIFFFMPETPLHYLKKGREEDARHALQWFRGKEYDIEDEIRAQKDTIERIEREQLSFKEAFKSRAAQKGMIVAMGLMLFQQLSGVNAVIFFASQIFRDAGSSFDDNISSVIVGVVQMIATFASTQIVDRLGRRILLLLSDGIMCLCTILLGMFFYLKESDSSEHKQIATDIGWLPLVSVCLFMIVFSLGFGPIPWMMVGELFPPNIKGVASSIACMFNWILAFLVTKFFSDLQHVMGSGPTFWLFAAVSGIGTAFVFFVVPETKGKSLQQIQIELGGGDIHEELPSYKK